MNSLRSRLKIRHVLVVSTIAEAGNLLRASQALNITQPAISKALAEVEERLGERLFDRTAAGALPTPAGEAVIRHGKRMLDDIDRMHDALDALRNGEAGTLRVGVFSLISRWEPFTRALVGLHAASPGLSLVIEDGNMEDLVPKLDAGRFDVIVGRYPYLSRLPHHDVRGLCSDRIVAAVRTGHPVLAQPAPDLARLVMYPWILPSERSLVRTQLEMELASAGLAFARPPIVSLATHANIGLIRLSDFVMLMPGCVATEAARANRLAIVPVDLPIDLGPLVAVWRSGQEGSRLRDRFVELLAEEIGTPPAS